MTIKSLDEIKTGDLVNGHQLATLLKDGGYRVLILYRGKRYVLDNTPLSNETFWIFIKPAK